LVEICSDKKPGTEHTKHKQGKSYPGYGLRSSGLYGKPAGEFLFFWNFQDPRLGLERNRERERDKVGALWGDGEVKCIWDDMERGIS
jgi:hypothetical protein